LGAKSAILDSTERESFNAMNPDLPHDEPSEEPIQPDLADDRPPPVLERLLDLAHDVSSYLRHHRDGAVRTSAALLLAASLAACGPSAPTPNTIAPLTQEVTSGLPSEAGRYPIQGESLARDAQGVYHFAWQQPGGASQWNSASASLVRLDKGTSNQLEIPSSGDPILHVGEDTPIQLVPTANDLATPTPEAGSTSSSSSSSSRGLAWFPFFGGMYSGPAYYNPAPQTAPGASRVEGSQASTSPPSAASRVSGLAHAVSGQSGGTGGGNAVTNRSGAGASSIGGQAGGVGSGSAATGKSGVTSSGSSGGIGATNSGGFSSGGGGGFSGSSGG
jgi:hypothetical protein